MCEPSGDVLSTVGLREVCVPTETIAPTVTIFEGKTCEVLLMIVGGKLLL